MNTTTTIPDIAAWVGCLGCYNDGRLVGRWLDGYDAQDLTAAGLTGDDGRCSVCGAEEFWVFDHQGIGNAGEMDVAEFVERAELFAEVAENALEGAFEAFLENEHRAGTADDLAEFQERYRGEWCSVAHFVEEYLDDCGMLAEIPESLRDYFDSEAYGRDLELNGDIYTLAAPLGAVWVFWSH